MSSIPKIEVSTKWQRPEVNANLLAVLLVLAILAFFFRNAISDRISGSGSGSTADQIDASDIAEQAMKRYAASMADVMASAASQAGTFNNNADFRKAFVANSTAARKDAFAAFDRVTNTAIGKSANGDSLWDPLRAAELLRKFEEGFRRIK